MTKELLRKAQAAGCSTAAHLAIWHAGYMRGQSDTFKEVTEDIEEGFPLFAEESIRIQKQKEEKEHYADYSDQEETK